MRVSGFKTLLFIHDYTGFQALFTKWALQVKAGGTLTNQGLGFGVVTHGFRLSGESRHGDEPDNDWICFLTLLT